MSELNAKMSLTIADEASQALREVSKSADRAASSAHGAQSANESLDSSLEGLSGAADEAAEAQEAQVKAADKAATSLEAEGKAVGDVNARLKQLEPVLKAAREGTLSLTEALRAAQSAGEKDFQAAANLKLAAEPLMNASRSIQGAVSGAVNGAADIAAAIGEAAASARATDAELGRMESAVWEIGRDSLKGVTGAAAALKALTRAGLDADAATASLGASLELAHLAGTDAATAAGNLSRVMQGFGVGADSAAHVSRVLSSAADSARLSEALGTSAAMAGQGGFSLSDAAALGDALLTGGRSGGEAGEGLKQIFKALSSQGTIEQLAGAGIRLDNADGTRRSVVEVFGEIDERLKKLKPGERAVALGKLFGEGAQSVEVALANLQKAREREQEILDPGDIDKAVARKKALLAGSAESGEALANAMDTLRASLGKALDPLKDFANKVLLGVVQGLADFAENHRVLTGTLMGSVAAIGAMTAAIGGLMTALSIASSAKGMLAVSSTLGAIVQNSSQVRGALTATTAALKVFTYWGKLAWQSPLGAMGHFKRELVANVFPAMERGWESFRVSVGKATKSIGEAVKSAWRLAVANKAALGSIALVAVAVVGVVKNFDALKGVFTGFVGLIGKALVGLMEAIQPVLGLFGVDLSDRIASVRENSIKRLQKGAAAMARHEEETGGNPLRAWMPSSREETTIQKVVAPQAPIEVPTVADAHAAAIQAREMARQPQPAPQAPRGEVDVRVMVSDDRTRVETRATGEINLPARAGLSWVGA